MRNNRLPIAVTDAISRYQLKNKAMSNTKEPEYYVALLDTLEEGEKGRFISVGFSSENYYCAIRQALHRCNYNFNRYSYIDETSIDDEDD